MQVEEAIILSAGKGTRMGPIGELLAKPVWPYFGKTLLDLQIEYLKQFGIKKFYVNSHHLYEQLEYLESDTVKIIFEPVLLDQGGGILNIIDKYGLHNKPILINNADQLYFITEQDYADALGKIKDCDVILFGIKVSKELGYNKLDIDSDQRVQGIIRNKESVENDFQTYSGMALLKCSKSDYDGKPISFFKSVADFSKKKVLLHELEGRDYYDFGKLDTYYKLCFDTAKLEKNKIRNPLTNFLDSIGIEIDADTAGLNFSEDKDVKVASGSILLNEGEIFLEDNKVISKLITKK